MGQRLLGRTNEGTLEPEPVAAGDRPALGSGGRALPWALRARPGPPGRTGRPTRPVRGEVTLRPSVIGPLTDSDSDGPCRERPGSWRGPVLAATSRRTGGEEKKPDARSPSGGRGRRAGEAGGPGDPTPAGQGCRGLSRREVRAQVRAQVRLRLLPARGLGGRQGRATAPRGATHRPAGPPRRPRRAPPRPPPPPPPPLPHPPAPRPGPGLGRSLRRIRLTWLPEVLRGHYRLMVRCRGPGGRAEAAESPRASPGGGTLGDEMPCGFPGRASRPSPRGRRPRGARGRLCPARAPLRRSHHGSARANAHTLRAPPNSRLRLPSHLGVP